MSCPVMGGKAPLQAESWQGELHALPCYGVARCCWCCCVDSGFAYLPGRRSGRLTACFDSGSWATARALEVHRVAAITPIQSSMGC